MKSLIRHENTWNPFKEMEEMQNRLSSLMGLSPSRGNDQGESTFLNSVWVPLVDIVEEEREYIIKAELPEIRKEDLQVSVENGMLTISGERKLEKVETKRKYHQVERAYGSFTRGFALPGDADGSKIEAEFKDGLLQVRIPKNEQAQPKAIEVKVL